MTEAQAIDYLMKNKGEVLAATAWEGYVAAGRGFSVTDAENVGYFPASMAVLFPPAIRKWVQRLVRSYQPETEIMVALSVPIGEQVMVAVGKRTPTPTPEGCCLKLTGTTALPPIQVVPFPVSERPEISLGDRVA